ncbi:hypothetical protein GGR57DRAFT_321038 [Xylariaceae sp. FL1272]|nr:hypothetical protein GGR57DRAFT_321038 [Xylariaceae sp. FL1272]
MHSLKQGLDLSAELDTYVYRPLSSHTQIRCIKILPGQKDVEIRLQEHGITHERPPYIFVSYGWGEFGDDRNAFVLCEGHRLPVRPNLWDFLIEYRRRQQTQLLWIDEICFNQSDMDETARQDKLLGQITHSAMSTICWVDAPEPTRISTIVADLSRIGRSEPLASVSASNSHYDICRDGTSITPEQLFTFQSQTANIDTVLWKSLDTFLDNDYFAEVWSLDWIWSQELHLWCGNVTISWDELCVALQACFRYSFRNRLSSPGFQNVLVMNLVRRIYREHQTRPTLYEALSAWHGCNFWVSDEESHVSAVLDICGTEIRPNATFEHNANERFYSLSLRVAHTLGVLSLSVAKGPSLTTFPNNSTSWVPNWDSTRKHYLLTQSDNKFSASPRTDCVVLGSTDSERLHCRGVVADTVKATATYLPPRRPCDHYIANGVNTTIFAEWFEFAEIHARQSRRVPYSETQLLFQFAETIQARGAETIWQIDWDECNITNQMRRFLEFCEDETEETMAIRLFYAACFPSHGNIFGVTERGYYCLLPPEAQQGDSVCIIYGNNVPIILRRRLSGDYENLGESYVNGLMQYKESQLRDCPEVDFIIF